MLLFIVTRIQRKDFLSLKLFFFDVINFSINDLEYYLNNNCIQISSAMGKILKPKDKENLIIYMKSPNLLKTDKYGTSMVLSFLEQIITYGGYYDKNIEWIGLENIRVSFCKKQ